MNDRIRYISVAVPVIVGLLVAAYIWLGKPSANDTQERLIEVKGTVYTPEGELLADAKVWVLPPAVEVTTDSAGVFTVSFNAPSSRQLLYVRDKGRKLIGSALVPAEGGQIEIKLKFAESVRGRVVDPKGRPVRGAQVGAVPMSNRYVLTDVDGRFDIAWALDWYEPGMDLYLFVRHADRKLAVLAPIPEDRTANIPIVVEPALALTGTVVDTEQRPICGARVAMSLVKGWECGTPVDAVVTDDKGCYGILALPQGQEYNLSATAEGYQRGNVRTRTFDNKLSSAQVEEIILKKPDRLVSGTVVDKAGNPIANIEVGVRGSGQPDSLRTLTDYSGRFIIEGVCPGLIEVWAKQSGELYGLVEAKGGDEDVRIVVSVIH